MPNLFNRIRGLKISRQKLVPLIIAAEILGILILVWYLRKPLLGRYFLASPKSFSMQNMSSEKGYLFSQDDFLIGKAVPNSKIKVFLTPGNFKQTIVSDNRGGFIFQIPNNISLKRYRLTVANYTKTNNISSIKSYKLRIQTKNVFLRSGIYQKILKFYRKLDVKQAKAQEINLGPQYYDWVQKMNLLGIFPIIEDEEIVLYGNEAFKNKFCKTGLRIDDQVSSQDLISSIQDNDEVIQRLFTRLHQAGYHPNKAMAPYFPNINFDQYIKDHNLIEVLLSLRKEGLKEDPDYISAEDLAKQLIKTGYYQVGTNSCLTDQISFRDLADLLQNDQILVRQILVRLEEKGYNSVSVLEPYIEGLREDISKDPYFQHFAKKGGNEQISEQELKDIILEVFNHSKYSSIFGELLVNSGDALFGYTHLLKVLTAPELKVNNEERFDALLGALTVFGYSERVTGLGVSQTIKNAPKLKITYQKLIENIGELKRTLRSNGVLSYLGFEKGILVTFERIPYEEVYDLNELRILYSSANMPIPKGAEALYTFHHFLVFEKIQEGKGLILPAEELNPIASKVRKYMSDLAQRSGGEINKSFDEAIANRQVYIINFDRADGLSDQDAIFIQKSIYDSDQDHFKYILAHEITHSYAYPTQEFSGFDLYGDTFHDNFLSKLLEVMIDSNAKGALFGDPFDTSFKFPIYFGEYPESFIKALKFVKVNNPELWTGFEYFSLRGSANPLYVLVAHNSQIQEYALQKGISQITFENFTEVLDGYLRDVAGADFINISFSEQFINQGKSDLAKIFPTVVYRQTIQDNQLSDPPNDSNDQNGSNISGQSDAVSQTDSCNYSEWSDKETSGDFTCSNSQACYKRWQSGPETNCNPQQIGETCEYNETCSNPVFGPEFPNNPTPAN